MTIHIPEWLLWVGGGLIAAVILIFAYVGFMLMLSFGKSNWP